MSIIRIHKNKNFTVMSNVHLRDMELSLKAKGLLSVMLSLPEEWSYSIGGLCSICKENETAIKSALTELKKKRYVIVNKHNPSKENNGRFQYEYLVYEEPQPEKSDEKQERQKQGIENLGVERLQVENIPLYKYTDKSNTDKLNTNNKNTDIDALKEESFKDSKRMDASFPGEKEGGTTQRNNKSISKTDYTEKELKSYLPKKLKQLYIQENLGVDERLKDFVKIVMYFYQQYNNTYIIQHPILSDMSYRKIVMEYLCPPEIMQKYGEYSFAVYKIMIDKYFTVDFGRYSGTPENFNYRISHFFSEKILEHLYRQTQEV